MKKITYPKAHRGNVSDNFHGTIVKDPYRWLEDENDENTVKWLSEQENLTVDFLNQYSEKVEITARLKELYDYTRYGIFSKHGGRYFYSKNDGLQAQAVMYMKKTMDGEPEIILDPNKWSDDGTVTYSSSYVTEDGKTIAYCLSESGSDKNSIKIKDIDTGKIYDEELLWCKFSGVAWKHDNSGFFYNRYPEPGTVAVEDECNYCKIFWHSLNTDQSEDTLIYEVPEDKEVGLFPWITDDGKFLILMSYKGTESKNRIFIKEFDVDNEFVSVIDEFKAEYIPIGNEGRKFYFKTTENSPKGKVIEIDIDRIDLSNSKIVITEHESDVIEQITYAGGKFIASYLHDAQNIIRTFDSDGKYQSDIKLPGKGSVFGLSTSQFDNELFFGYTSFFQPLMIIRYDIKKDQSENLIVPECNFDPGDYKSEQIFFESKDGTKIPMFISAKRGTLLNGKNPAILYGYGGFDISLKPSFSVFQMYWLESGGIWATANLRGGGEYGEKWHNAGILEKKQNVFDDFIAAGEYLVEEEYTSKNKLAISGGSNGGLLVSACMVQRPDLYGAVLCGVPVIDMLRFHKFTVGRFWICEYGNAEKNSDHFKFMYKYSPLHNVSSEENYPSIMILTADHDDRVSPAHAFKFAAELQNSDSRQNPILLRVDRKAGHGHGKPLMKYIDEATDKIAFLNMVLR